MATLPRDWTAEDWADWALDFIAMSGPLPLYAGRAFDPLNDANDLFLVLDEIERREHAWKWTLGYTNRNVFRMGILTPYVGVLLATGIATTRNLAVLLAAHALEKK